MGGVFGPAGLRPSLFRPQARSNADAELDAGCSSRVMAHRHLVPSANGAPLLGSRLMGERRADADYRRFFDEFECVKIPRLRASGVVQLDALHAVIPFNDKSKLIALAHTKFRHGGSWSYLRCPRCDRRCNRLWSVDDALRCCKCCEAMAICHRSQYGFGRTERMRAADQSLDRLISKLETSERLRLNGAPPSWGGKAQLVYRSRRLTQHMRRSMITLRLRQLASQHANDGGLKLTRSFKPRAEALAAIPELGQVWRARSTERLEQALDTAQSILLKALESNDPRRRLSAARIMLKTKQARERGFRT
jgi:hypothetical protein